MVGMLQISSLRFRAGSAKGEPPLETRPSGVVVLVGPNNSGKSLALREIEQWCNAENLDHRVVDSMAVRFPTAPEEALRLARRFRVPNTPGGPESQLTIACYNFDKGEQHSPPVSFQGDTFKDSVVRQDSYNLRLALSRPYTIRLDGRNRLRLTESMRVDDLLGVPANHLIALFKDDSARERVRQLCADAFNLHFVIDPTGLKELRIRMSERAPMSSAEEQSLDQSARAFHSKARSIDEFGDGVKAFVGLVSVVYSLPHRIILVDEPEAFLHPPHARRIGGILSEVSRERQASLVVATHSPDFLIGCVESSDDASIIRLTYDRGVATARSLPANVVAGLARDPLLRSTDTLNALFHSAAVITEGDADRAFYGEMNRRLLMVGRGIKDALFLNAQNKQTVHRLIEPLRRLGIPAAGIVDLDILKQGTEWDSLLLACQVPEKRRAEMGVRRERLEHCFKIVPRSPGVREPMKLSGLAALNSSDQAEARALLEELSTYGLFAVPPGELESWLPHLSVGGGKSEWLVRVFSRIGQSPDEPSYLRPANDDVWEFLDRIADWVSKPNRLGVNP